MTTDNVQTLAIIAVAVAATLNGLTLILMIRANRRRP